jgi:polysaccharide biosynthesis protein PslJ
MTLAPSRTGDVPAPGRHTSTRSLAANLAQRVPPVPAMVVPIVYSGLLLVIPSRLAIRQIGAPGTPANIFAIIALVLWLCFMTGGLHSRRGWSLTRTTLAMLVVAVLVSYVSGNLVGWYQPADIHQSSDRLWRSVSPEQLNAVLDSAGNRGLLALAGWAGIVLLTAEGTRSWRDLERIVAWLVGFATVVAALGVFQYFTGVNVAGWFRLPGLSMLMEQNTFTRSILNRVVVTAAHPIELGVVMAGILPLALHRGLHTGRVIPWTQAAIIFLVCLMSVSRSAIVVMGVATVILLAGWPTRWRLWALILAPIAAVAVRAAFPGLLGTIRALFTNLANDPSIAGRTTDYEIVMRTIHARPMFGQGLYTWVPFYFRTIDNQALMFALEIGLVGTAVFVVLVVAHLAGCLMSRSRATDPRASHLALAIAAGLSGLLTSYVTFDAISFLMVSGVTFLFVGLAGATWNLARHEGQALPNPV